jgi:hypothetical protein
VLVLAVSSFIAARIRRALHASKQLVNYYATRFIHIGMVILELSRAYLGTILKLA